MLIRPFAALTLAALAAFSTPAFATGHVRPGESTVRHEAARQPTSRHVRPSSVTVVDARYGALEIDNRSGRSLTLRMDGRVVDTIRPGRTSLRMPTRAHLTATLDGRVLGEISGLPASGVTVWTLDAPAVGTVYVDNNYGRPVGVYVDGRRVGKLTPNARMSLSLSTGGHRIELVDDRGGPHRRTIRSLSVTVDAWDPLVVAVAGGGASSHHHHARR